MLAITLIELKITVNTIQGKNFQARIPFQEGLNLIRADNTSGKSTCVNAIAYALGLESILGPLKNKPFPKSLYEIINDSKHSENKYTVTNSFVELTIKNNRNNIVTIKRLIKNPNNIITVKENSKDTDYFLKAYGKIGSAKSEYGFHNWLENFMGWKLPLVPGIDDKQVKLYLEAIFPLFFIEQKRGWSEIQANVPINFGIKNVKKTAIEYVLNISNFHQENKLNSLKKNLETYEEQWNFGINAIESLCSLYEIGCERLSKISSQQFPLNYFIIGLNNNISLDNERAMLIKRLKGYQLYSDNDLEKSIDFQREKIRNLSILINNLENNKEKVAYSFYEAERKENILYSDLQKYKQLEILTNLGAENKFSINLEECPICHNKLSDQLHISHKKTEALPMSLQQNISFLKEQYDFIKAIKFKHKDELKYLEYKISVHKEDLKNESYKLSKYQEDLSDLHGDIQFKIRNKIEIEYKIKKIDEFIEKFSSLEKTLIELQNKWLTSFDSYNLLKKNIGNDEHKKGVISELEKLMQKNLSTFGFSTSGVDKITISRTTLRPEQNGYDIIAETSASDYIRTIWAFTLALLEIANNSTFEIHHGGFVIFDEPRQHETKTKSLNDLLIHSSKLFETAGQVIFTTSFENLEDLSINLSQSNIIYFEDYILQPL